MNPDRLPTLYSLQHCPYAMRARLGLLLAKQQVMLKAVVTKNKPDEMLAFSPKGTVPVLVVESGYDAIAADAIAADESVEIIDESLDIMIWALTINDPDDLLFKHTPDMLKAMKELIRYNDTIFKPLLEQYKDAKRYHIDTEADLRAECESFIHALELRLSQHQYLMGDSLSLADYALLPFVRQFARVDRHKYLHSPTYPLLRVWLRERLDSPVFSKMMNKFPLYLDTGESYLFG